MERKEIGVVKWFNKDKGFGFINKENDQTDIFVHYSQIQQKGFKSLETGDSVSFIMFETENGYQAKQVLKIKSKLKQPN